MKTPPYRLPTIDESAIAIEKLRRRYESPKIGPKRKDEGKEKEVGMTNEDVPCLRQQWYNKYEDILQGTREELPSLREVNHEINLINPNQRYTYHLPRCPTALHEEFHVKLNRYMNAGWWELRTATQAAVHH